MTWTASSAAPWPTGLLTLLLGGGYAVVVLGLGQLLGRESPLVVAAATLAVAALFQPARRRVQAVVDRRFNRRRHDATGSSRGSGPTCATRSTSTPSRLTCWRWSTRPCSRPRHRCGYDRKRRRERLVSPWRSNEPEGRNDRQPDDLRPARRTCGLVMPYHPGWPPGQVGIAAAGGADRRSAKNAAAPMDQSREAHHAARPLHSPEGAMSRHVAELGQRTCFGSSPENARCEAAFPQDRRDRSSPNQVVS